MGGVLKTSVRRPRICAAISRPLYPSRGHLQPSPGLLHRWPGHLSLARFGSPQSTEAQNPIGRQVLTSLLTAHPSERLRAHSTFRLSGQPPAHQASAALLSVAGLETTAASGTPRFLHRRGSWSLSLPQLWRTNEGHRVAHRCRHPASFSTSGNRCGMKTLSPTRIFRVLRHAPYLCVLPLPKSLLPASSALVIVILSCGSQPLGTGCRELLSVAQSRHTSTPLLPTIEFP